MTSEKKENQANDPKERVILSSRNTIDSTINDGREVLSSSSFVYFLSISKGKDVLGNTLNLDVLLSQVRLIIRFLFRRESAGFRKFIRFLFSLFHSGG